MAGLTLADVASSTGYAQTTLSSVENHHDQPSKRLFAKWIHALGINESWLNTGQGEPFTKAGIKELQALRTGLAAPVRSRLQKAREYATNLLHELDQIERDLSGSKPMGKRRKRS
jgi:transcriptional regulator with XRE-family HTH domain